MPKMHQHRSQGVPKILGLRTSAESLPCLSMSGWVSTLKIFYYMNMVMVMQFY